jgi:hypothetical protein
VANAFAVVFPDLVANHPALDIAYQIVPFGQRQPGYRPHVGAVIPSLHLQQKKAAAF